VRFSEVSCRERWEELYQLRGNREEVKIRKMEDKRAMSVSVFSDPFSQYNLDEMLHKLSTS